MKKIVPALVVALVFATLAVATGQDEDSDEEEKIKQCMADTGATYDEVEELFFGDEAAIDSDKDKCFLGCLYERHGVLDAGSISERGLEIFLAGGGFSVDVRQRAARCVKQIASSAVGRCRTGPAVHSCILGPAE